MALSPSERVELGLDEPERVAAGASEFAYAAGQLLPANHAPPNRERNLRLVLKEGEKTTAPKIRLLVNELLAGNLENADWALKQLFAANPKAGLELYIELSKFSLPQLKAVAVEVNDRSENPRAMTYGDLQRLLTQD